MPCLRVAHLRLPGVKKLGTLDTVRDKPLPLAAMPAWAGLTLATGTKRLQSAVAQSVLALSSPDYRTEMFLMLQADSREAKQRRQAAQWPSLSRGRTQRVQISQSQSDFETGSGCRSLRRPRSASGMFAAARRRPYVFTRSNL